jgi:hypothetical protein
MAKAIAVIDEAVAGLPALEKAPEENDRRGLITPSGPLTGDRVGECAYI